MVVPLIMALCKARPSSPSASRSKPTHTASSTGEPAPDRLTMVRTRSSTDRLPPDALRIFPFRTAK